MAEIAKKVNSCAENPWLAGNWLPDGREAVVAAIAHDPFRDPAWRAQNSDLKFLRNYLKKVVVPTATALRIATAAYDLIRIGYALRDPRAIGAKQRFASAPNFSVGEVLEEGFEGMLIIGETGNGKSHPLKAALRALPQRIRHGAIPELHLDHLDQVPYIYVKMTGIIGVEALLLKIVAFLDTALQAKGESMKAIKRGTRSVEGFMENVVRAMKTHHVGGLFVDEIQPGNFNLSSKEATRLRNLLIGIANEGIPLIFSGNPLAMTFAGTEAVNGQLKRRLFGEDPIRVPVPLGPDEDLLDLLVALARCTLVPVRCEWSDENMAKVYSLTAGIDAFVVALWAEVQRLKLPKRGLVVTPELLEDAAKRSSQLHEFEPMIRGFVERDGDSLAKHYSDIDVAYYKRVWHSEAANLPAVPTAPQTPTEGTVEGASAKPTAGVYPLAGGGGAKEAASRLGAPIKADITRRRNKNVQDDAQIEKLKAHRASDLKALIEQK